MKGFIVITPIKQIMTQDIISVPYFTSLFQANEIMKEKRIRHLPVTDGRDNIVGIISQRDLNYVPDSKQLKVGMMMKSSLEFVDYNLPLRQAIFIMLEKKISSLLVCDASNAVVGIVTTDDILWHLAHLLTFEKNECPILKDVSSLNVVGEVAQAASAVGV